MSELDYIDSKIVREDLEKEERDERIIEQWASQLPDVDFNSKAVKDLRKQVIAEMITEEEDELEKLKVVMDIEEDDPNYQEIYNNTLADVEKKRADRERRIGILNSINEIVWQL